MVEVVIGRLGVADDVEMHTNGLPLERPNLHDLVMSTHNGEINSPSLAIMNTSAIAATVTIA
jgi:hypothetical protein